MSKHQKKCPHRYVDTEGRCHDCRQPVDLSERRNKYGAKRKDGFDSTAEARRYRELRLLEISGGITGLERQRRFTITVNGWQICEYVSDFDYFDSEGRQIVEDVKGVKTAVYRLKRKLMLACHGIDVKEVKA